MNIDKDINYLKRQIETSERQFEEIGVGCLSSKEIEAISNVLSELKELQETLKCTQDSWYKDTQELETYKKIAEKLAEVVDLGYMPFDCSPMCIHDNCIKECVLDWAKREVENEENNSNN